MGNGQLITEQGKLIAFNRLWNSIPTYSSPSVFKVGTGTTTPNISDTDLASAITISGNPTKAFLASYPYLEELTLNSTVRAVLLTTECNSSSITEFGIFNTDGTNKCFSRAVFTAITKTNTVQVIFLEKDKII